MGYRTYILSNYEIKVADQIGKSYQQDEMIDFLRNIGLRIGNDESCEHIEIDRESLINLNLNKLSSKKKMQAKELDIDLNLLKSATQYAYAKKCGFVALKSF